MRLCLKYNATIVNMQMPDSSFLDFDEKQKTFTGNGGEVLLSSFLLKRKKETQLEFFRFCKFKIMGEDGRILENGTYNGVIGELEQKKADFTIKMQNMYVDPEKVDLTKVFEATDWLLGHFINETSKKEPRFLNYNRMIDTFMPSYQLFAEFIMLIFLSFLVGLLLIINRKQPTFKNYLVNFFHFSDKLVRQPSSISFLLLFNILFLFLTRQFLASNIKTSKVVVEKDFLIYHDSKIYSTKMNCCFLQQNKDTDFFKFSKPGTIPYFIYNNKTNPEHPCIMFDEKGLKMNTNFFLLGIRLHMAVLRTLNAIYNLDIYYLSKPIISLNSVLYLSKNVRRKSEITKELNKWSTRYMERGYSIKYLEDSSTILKKNFPVKNEIYYSVEDYINQNTIINNLTYEKFSCFFLLYSLMISIFTLCYLWLELVRLLLKG